MVARGLGYHNLDTKPLLSERERRVSVYEEAPGFRLGPV